MSKTEKVKCEVITKVVGYARPVSKWNAGKQQEWKDRKLIGDNR